MKILFCFATQQEGKVIKEAIKELKIKRKCPFEYFCTWIGNYSCIFSLTKYLLEHNDQTYFIINIGICGYVGEYYPCIQGAIIKHKNNMKENIIPIPIKIAPLQTIISSETIVTQQTEIQNQTWTYFIDMESYGIEYVAQQFHFPRLYIKVPIDQIWEETISFNKENALKRLKNQINYQDVIERLIDYLEKLTQK